MVAAPGAIELIVGCRWDRRLGPLLLLGLGGIFAEVLHDTAVALAPADPVTVERLLLGLRGASLLTGARGRQPLAVRAAAEAAAALSVLGARHPELDEIEINPLLVTPSEAIALDARVVHSQPR
jgi:acyl-CoA synthetase (NDP forming)